MKVNYDINFRNVAFYYDGCDLYWFKTPNEDVKVCSNLKQEGVLQAVADHVEELIQDLQMDANSIKDTIGYIQNETTPSDIMHEIVSELESRYEDLQMQTREITDYE